MHRMFWAPDELAGSTSARLKAKESATRAGLGTKAAEIPTSGTATNNRKRLPKRAQASIGASDNDQASNGGPGGQASTSKAL